MKKPYPETRGSHTAHQAELLRVSRVSSKSQAKENRPRLSKLCAEFEIEHGYPFKDAAVRLGLEHGDELPHWQLEVAEADGVIGRLLACAQKLWPAED